MVTDLPGGTVSLPPGFFTWLPSQRTLCVTGALFFTRSDCPSRSATTCGTKAQLGWSTSGAFTSTALSDGCTGSLAPEPASSDASQTKAFFTPLLALLTTQVSLRI